MNAPAANFAAGDLYLTYGFSPKASHDFETLPHTEAYGDLRHGGRVR